MLLRTSFGASLISSTSEASFPSAVLHRRLSLRSSVLSCPAVRRSASGVVYASGGEINKVLTGVVFEPFEEVKKELELISSSYNKSLARQQYAEESEAAINDQINVEYNVSYCYHALFAYFDRDNVALKGIAKFFKESSDEEREHAEKFMEYQNKRGGQVKLQPIILPLSEFDHEEKGDALHENKQERSGVQVYLHMLSKRLTVYTSSLIFREVKFCFIYFDLISNDSVFYDKT